MPRIEQRDIDAIQFAEVNPKLHDQGALASSEQRYGFVEIPVEREETGRLVAGQGRIEALRAIKKAGKPAPIGVTERDGKWFVDVRVFPFKSDAEAQAYLADSNNLGLLGGDFNAFDIARLWDSDQYTAMLKELAEQASLPVSVDEQDLSALIAASNPPEPESTDPGELVDKAQELQQKWNVARGDLWEIGKHRILCGDSTNAGDVARVMQGERAVLLATDPPYNVGKDYGKEVDDEKIEAEYETFSRLWFGNWRAVSDRQIVTPAFANLWAWMRFFDKPKHIGAWTKTNSMTRGSVCQFSCFEPILFYGDRFKRTRHDEIFNYPVGIADVGHPCPKPPKLWVDLIDNYSEAGEIIADAFLGSGTTLVACEQTGRIGRGLEIEPRYVAVCLERLSKLGLTCQRVSSD